MRSLLLTTLFLAIFSVAASAQVTTARFPGVSAEAKRQLATAKRTTPIALPTWVPAGFKISLVQMELGPRVKIEDRHLTIVYTRTLSDGRLQRFAIQAGFDGLGDLMYPEEDMKELRTPIGKVWLVYQPKDEDGKRLTDFAMTEWFDVGKTAFHYIGMYGTDEGDGTLTMIPRAETERILRSLQRY